jgi:thymidylate synthase
MIQLGFGSLGETWLNLLNLALFSGTRMEEEGSELLEVCVSFPAATDGDPLLRQFLDPQMLAEMKRVFFTDGPNRLGHNYAPLIRGPGGRSDLQDVIAVLRARPATKRAVLTIGADANGTVPCINAIQFLIRHHAVQTMYFARGQDIFAKFCADGVCIATLAQTVASALQLPAGRVTGFIGSSHIYNRDRLALQEVLAQGRPHLRALEQDKG